jgi:hypothetical protein
MNSQDITNGYMALQQLLGHYIIHQPNSHPLTANGPKQKYWYGAKKAITKADWDIMFACDGRFLMVIRNSI